MSAQMPTPLTEEDMERFEHLAEVLSVHQRTLLPEGVQVAVVRTMLGGSPVAVVTVITETEETYDLTPLAVLVDDALFDLLADPSGEAEDVEESAG